MSEMDDVAMKQEIMLEAYAGILASFWEYFDGRHIDPEHAERETTEITMFRKARAVKDSILDARTMKEMNEIVGQFKLFKFYVKELERDGAA